MFNLFNQPTTQPHTPWNKGKLIGQRPPLKKQEIWSIRVRLELDRKIRDLALFNLAIDSKLRACDLTKIRVRDICTAVMFLVAPWSCSRRLSNLSGLN